MNEQPVNQTGEKMGEYLLRELKWIHSAIRNDLAVCRELAGRVAAGIPAEDAQARIKALQTSGPLWKLRTNCLYYCHFVHSHHQIEDSAFFPVLRRADPAMEPIVDKLQADHRQVSRLLDEIEAGANVLAAADSAAARERLVYGLSALASDLLAHLDYEEQSIAPIVRTWTAWPA